MCSVSGPGQRRLIIILGASGRLGTALLPHLLNLDVDIVGICRKQPTGPCTRARWLLADVADHQRANRAATELARLSTGYPQTVLIDLCLDRSSVTAMRDSIKSAAHFTDLLAARAVNRRQSLLIVTASSTSVLAPWALQTPYGVAKRRQLQHYAASGVNGSALLLPKLRTDGSDACLGLPTWTYELASRQITARLQSDADSDAFVVYVPTVLTTPMPRRRRKLFLTMRDVVRWWGKRVGQPNSPLAHRNASRALLDLLPHHVRRHVDHHLAPPGLVQRLATRHNISVRRMTSPP